MSRLRPGKAFKAAERISSSAEHTLLFASANKNPSTDGLGLRILERSRFRGLG
jgi:hypothetical protein